MRRVTVTVALLCAMTMAVLAQSRPDFSGTWEMDVERSRAENRARAAAASGTAAGTGAQTGGGGGSMGGVATMSPGGGGSMGAAGGAPAVTVVKVTQTATSLTIDRISGQVWEKMVHRLDGTESINVNGNSTLKIKSHWEGAKLVSEGKSETKLGDGSGTIASSVKEVRWMEKPGVMAIESTRTITSNTTGTQIGSAGRPNTSIQYFVRK